MRSLSKRGGDSFIVRFFNIGGGGGMESDMEEEYLKGEMLYNCSDDFNLIELKRLKRFCNENWFNKEGYNSFCYRCGLNCAPYFY